MSVESELLELQQQADGLLQVEPVVKWAEQHPDSALHGALEWDDQEAGHAWRCHQVRRLIAVHIVNAEGERQLVSLTIDRSHEGGGYRSIDAVLSVQKFRQVLLQDALDELERVQHKYEHLVELSKVWQEANKVRQRHQRTQQKEVRQRPQKEA